MSEVLKCIADSLYVGDAGVVSDLTQMALDKGLSAEEVLAGGLVAGMDRVGADFRSGELYVPEVLIAARAMCAGMDVLRPLLTESDVESAKVVVDTVAGDLHDIGKNLVVMMLEGGGFEVTYAGIDVPQHGIMRRLACRSLDALSPR